jgi:hypothetical protein
VSETPRSRDEPEDAEREHAETAAEGERTDERSEDDLLREHSEDPAEGA